MISWSLRSQTKLIEFSLIRKVLTSRLIPNGMVGRFIKAFWFFSLLTSLANLLYVYAGLSQQVIYGADTESWFTDKETFFYMALAILVVYNFSFYALSKNMKYRNEALNTLLINWQLSFTVVLNGFYIVGLNFVFLLNSGEKFNYDSFGYLIFVALGLIVIWLLALPVLVVRQTRLS